MLRLRSGVAAVGALATKESTFVTAQSAPIDSPLDRVCRVQFETADILRRAQGRTFQAVGFGPDECPYRVVASGPFWVLRDYGKDGAMQCVLIVAAPIKRPVHLGLGSLVERNPLLLESGLACAPARMVAGLTDDRE